VVIRRFGCLAAVAIAACAATGVTLRSNHFRLAVPADWQVIEAGGDGVLPTLRLFPWVVEGPLADPTGEAFKRLGAAGVIGPAADGSSGGSPCPDRNTGFVVFGEPARAINFEAAQAQRLVVTAGHAYGSLVAIVASTRAERPLCAEIDAMHAAIGRLTGALRSSGDPARPGVRPILLQSPDNKMPIEIPAADPNPSP
jgi:hypothetical protein